MKLGMYLYFSGLIVLFCAGNATMTGGWSQKDVNSPKIADLAKLAMKHISDSSTLPGPVMLRRVVEAASQVVAGTNYRLKLEVDSTKCKNTDNNIDSCEIDKNDAPKVCQVTIWERSWLDETKVTEASCK